jgi:hypothetical protein
MRPLRTRPYSDVAKISVQSKDGFVDALARIGRVEQTLGMANLADYTAPPPPRP